MFERPAGMEETTKSNPELKAAVKKIRAHDDPKHEEVAERAPGSLYSIEREIGEQRLEFLGSSHTSDPNDLTIEKLRTRRDEFLEQTPNDKIIFMVEGMHEGVDHKKLGELLADVKTEDDAIKRYGEKGVLMWAAKERNIEITSPEPKEEQVVQELVGQGFDREDIALTFLLRDLPQALSRTPEQSGNKEFRNESLEKIAAYFYTLQEKTGINWIKDAKAREELRKLAQDPARFRDYQEKIANDFIDSANARFKMLPGMTDKSMIPSLEALLDRDKTKFPITDINSFYDPIDFEDRKAITNQVSSAYNISRDQELVRKITENLQSGKSPLVVYGANHAVSVELALDEIISQLEAQK